MLILSLTPKLKLRRYGNCIVLESRVKLVFSVRNRQSERKPKFDAPKLKILNIEGICKNRKSSGDK
jgi:hypothetical protein